MNSKKVIIGILIVCIIIGLDINPYRPSLEEAVPNIEGKWIINQDEEKEVLASVDLGRTIVLDDRGQKEIGYVLEFSGQKGMLSRDGSKSQEVVSGTILNRVGTYYLVSKEEESKETITKIEIVGEPWQDYHRVSNQDELEEVLKRALEEFSTTFSLQLMYGELTLEEVNARLFSTIENLMKQYPKLVFESYTITGRSEIDPIVEVEITYPIEDIEKLKIYEQMIENQTLELLTNFADQKEQDYEREWQIYQYVIEKIEYSQEFPLPMTHTLYGALIEGVAVCDGYAKSVMYLLNNVGIPTELVVGEAENVLHAWNKVKIQDEYYYVDATWGDLEENQIGGFYNYFNENRNYMEETHSWDEESEGEATNIGYTFINLPLEREDLHKVSDRGEWEVVLNQFKKDRSEEASVIFYDVEKNKWDTQEIIADLCNQLESSLEYHITEKYEALIISYRLYKEIDRVRE